MPHKLCRVLGFALLLAGFAGFVSPNLLGMHLTAVHNVVHLVSGGLALYFGFANPAGARGFLLGFGSIYGLLAVMGFVAPQMFGRIIGHGDGAADARRFLVDNVVHVLITAACFVGAFAGAPRKTPIGYGR